MIKIPPVSNQIRSSRHISSVSRIPHADSRDFCTQKKKRLHKFRGPDDVILDTKSHRAWLKTSQDPKAGESKTQRIPGLRGRIVADHSLPFFFSFAVRATGFFLIAGISESLIQADNKKDDEPFRRTGGPPTCCSIAGPALQTLSVTSA